MNCCPWLAGRTALGSPPPAERDPTGPRPSRATRLTRHTPTSRARRQPGPWRTRTPGHWLGACAHAGNRMGSACLQLPLASCRKHCTDPSSSDVASIEPLAFHWTRQTCERCTSSAQHGALHAELCSPPCGPLPSGSAGAPPPCSSALARCSAQSFTVRSREPVAMS